MVTTRESFWTIVHAKYMVRDICRADLRDIVASAWNTPAGTTGAFREYRVWRRDTRARQQPAVRPAPIVVRP